MGRPAAAVRRFLPPTTGKDDAKKLHEQLAEEAKKVYDRHVKGLNEFVKENGDKIKAHFESLKRYEEGRKTDPRTMFQTQRRWDEMQDLRKEAKGWIADLDARENALKGDLLDLLSKDRKSEVEAVASADKEEPRSGGQKRPTRQKPDRGRDRGEEVVPAGEELAETNATEKSADELTKTAEKSRTRPRRAKIADAAVVVVDFSPLAENHAATGPFAASSNPLDWKWIEQLAFLLTWSLFGIGLCLMLGLFTRPAALAGAGFMLFVVLSQPSYPGVYPLDPPQLGHALLVNKDFVEMIALLVIASTSLGRWTGLDFFIHNFLIKPFCWQLLQVAATQARPKDEKHEQFL